MPILRTILFTAQAAPSPTPLPVVATDGILSFEAAIEFDVDKLERNKDKSFLGANPSKIIGTRAKITFDFEIMGAAVAGNAAPIGRVLECCGMLETLVPATSATYSYISTGHKNALIYFYWGDGSATDLLFVVSAAKGSITTSVKSKEYWKGKATFTGTVALPTEAGAPTGVILTGFQDPAAATTELADLEVNGTAVRCYQFDMNDGNEVKAVEDFKFRRFGIQKRSVGGVIYVVKEAFSVINPFTLANSGASNTIQCQINDGPGRIATANVYNATFDFPKLTTYEDEPAYEITYIGEPITGNDEADIVFS